MLALGASCAAEPAPLRKSASVDFKSCAKPEWPRASLTRSEQGTVTLGFLIGDSGEVIDAVVRQSSGSAALDGAALRGIRKCRFHPATLNGTPMAKWTTMQYVWKLESPQQRQRDSDDARRHRDAALKGDVDSLYQLAELFSGKFTLARDLGYRNKMLHLAAERGHAEAQADLAAAYQHGVGLPAQKAEALRWYEKAAAAGLARARFALAIMLEQGREAPKEMARATQLLQQAAEQNHTEAQYRLAQLYLSDQNGGRDAEAALTWLRRAADAGHSGAQADLGRAYLRGDGIGRDEALALAWLQKSAALKHPPAQALLAEMMLAGQGQPADVPGGMALLRRAALGGHIGAMATLGKLLAEGAHGPADPVEAETWLRKAGELRRAGLDAEPEPARRL